MRCLPLVLACACVAVLVVPALPASSTPDRDVLYQSATLDALLAGLYGGTLPIAELSKHGDFGLGTFDRLDGEMVVLDGIVYQVTSDGVAHRWGGGGTTPFAAVTFFSPDISAAIGQERDLAGLKEYLDALLPSRNLFHAIRIEGTFKRVTVRSVPAQAKPYPRLEEVTAKQPTFTLTDVKGTLVALRCPYFVQGVNVPGYHMHFLTADRRRGGHVLDCVIAHGVVTVDVTPRFALSLPRDGAFYRTDFQAAPKTDLNKVE